MKTLKSEETIHWVCGTFAGGVGSDENQPFKRITTSALGESVLPGLEDMNEEERRSFIGHALTSKMHEPYAMGTHVIDIVRTPQDEVLAIVEWRENETTISGHGGSGEEYDLCRATVAVDDAKTVSDKWTANVDRWMKKNEAELEHRKMRRRREEVLRAHGLDQGTVLRRREEVLGATDIPKQYWN